MENNNFIESAIILNITSLEDIKKIRHPKKDFAVLGEAYEFVIDYFDEHREIPTRALLYKKFPFGIIKTERGVEEKEGLDPNAVGVTLDYSLVEFENQVLSRKILSSYKDNIKILRENPKKAFNNILARLEDVGLALDDDIVVYDNSENNRFSEYEKRKEQSNRGIKMLGIPTIFKTINGSGMGYLPGDLITFFARPMAGKTWFCIKTAAIALSHNYKTLFITAEMPSSQINMRLDVVLSNMMGYNISHTRLQNGTLYGDEEEQYLRFLKECDKKKLFICDHIGNDSITIRGIKNLISKHSPDIIIVDAVYLLGADNSNSDSWQQMGQLFGDLKKLAVAKNIVVVVTTQANRNAADAFIQPTAKDVSFGDAAFRSSDMMFSMCLVDGNYKEREVQLQKMRNRTFEFNKKIGDTTYLKFDVDIGVVEEKPDDEI